MSKSKTYLKKRKCTHGGAIEATAKRGKDRSAHSVIIVSLVRFPMITYTMQAGGQIVQCAEGSTTWVLYRNYVPSILSALPKNILKTLFVNSKSL